jgi:tetratricopeptide (TPR) repeat protein
MKNILFALALLISFVSFGQTTLEYFDSGYDKAKAKDYYGAIADYTKAIEIDPTAVTAYFNRGVSKSDLKDYYGAIADFTKAIELNPNDANAYAKRGVSKENLGDLNGACVDWKKAAALGNKIAAGWVAKQCN